MTTTPPAPAWYPDPTGRFQHRFWDGAQWTDSVATNGETSSDPIGGAPPSSDATPLFTEPILAVNRTIVLNELSVHYPICDQTGREIAGVYEVGQSAAKKAQAFLAARKHPDGTLALIDGAIQIMGGELDGPTTLETLGELDQLFAHDLEIRATNGALLLRLNRRAKLMNSTLVVFAPDGSEIGKVVQQPTRGRIANGRFTGKVRFALESGGQHLGSIDADSWQAWNFTVTDATGTEVASVARTLPGVDHGDVASPAVSFVQIHRPLSDPLRSLVVAAGVTMDGALRQGGQ